MGWNGDISKGSGGIVTFMKTWFFPLNFRNYDIVLYIEISNNNRAKIKYA